MNTEYLALVEAVFNNASQFNIDRVEAFEVAHPSVVDDVYRDAGKHEYEIVTGTVSKV